MTFDSKANLLGLLYLLNRELHEQAEKDQTEVNAKLKAAIETLINYLD